MQTSVKVINYLFSMTNSISKLQKSYEFALRSFVKFHPKLYVKETKPIVQQCPIHVGFPC
jgi:hypothetical protein